ncbi:uncharacterized protein NECHADRAFT_83740 [Fusarium vanettenii 77-13-4]|uniref:Uncharacterized protein n=1 Tax=Fusarium vanettenii (strain ATCC MYA-4622 / CBS 123669 / FGSC 9596 / NRRL 45880 / 77-13-4) TaxID=660122 RepID=C7YYM4_FUSV7|nr:uncharacterized protein NECHADRAFT_83740 [Fusarium vanettenii 77-13-4]EEU43029.1 predicted protein [Fusarium vanettenii 77-13-4]
MGLWEVKDDKKTLNKELFLGLMEQHWLDWGAEKLSRKEKQAWIGITEIVYKGKVKVMTDLPEPDTWAEVTTYKVLFPKEFFYSRYAAVAQIKFPQADLAKWEPNVSGPTTTHAFQQNRFIKQKRLGECFRQATELSKRAWTPEPTQSVYPLAKRSRNLPAKEAPVETGPVNQVDGPLISKPEDVSKIFGNIEQQLASVRAAAESNTKIHQHAVDELRKSHEPELKKVQKYAEDTIKSIREGHRKEMEDTKKAHEEELTKVCGTYQAAISTLNNACLDGIAALEKARQKALKACLDGAE